jgi:outer membrane protein assembly factor BamB
MLGARESVRRLRTRFMAARQAVSCMVALACAGASLAVAQEPPGSAAGLEVVASKEPGWPQFRGPRRDGVSEERGLLQVWPEEGPAVRWKATGAGKGFSSPVIAGDRLFLTGDFGEAVFVIAYDLAGKELWRTRNGDAWLNQFQGARASVAVSAGKVYHQNAHGRVACFEAATGRELWAVNVLEHFKGENIRWGLSECLLVDEERVYVTAGGREALMVALDKDTGEVRWRTPSLVDPETQEVETATYAPPLLVTFAGRRLVIACSARHLFCVDANTGALQWTQRRPTPYAVQAVTPTVVGDGIFMAAPLGAPGKLYRLLAPAAGTEPIGVQEAWTSKLDTCHGGVIHRDGRLYGSYYPRRGGWAALDARTGEVLYETMEYAKGAALWADNRLYVLAEDGWMLLFEPTATEFAVRGKFRFVTARDRDAWAHPVILDGRMYLRFHDTLTCFEVRRRNESAD